MTNRTKMTAGTLAVVAAVALRHTRAEGPATRPATQPVTPASVTAGAAEAAKAFLATLTPGQQAKVLYKFDDDAQRARWSNFPAGVVPRGGIGLKELSEPQRAAAMRLVASVLSAQGYEKVQQIMDADDAFKAIDTGPGGGGRGPTSPPGNGRTSGQRAPGTPGGPPSGRGPGFPPGANARTPGQRAPGGAPGMRGGPGGPGRPGGPGGPGGGQLFGKENYYVSILGTPSDAASWMLKFGGHHLALNITLDATRGVLTPTLTGAQPAVYKKDGKTIRVLAGESDKGLALLNALDSDQRTRAILNYKVGDLVLGPGHDDETIQPEGLQASSMNAKQKAMLMDVIGEWAGIANDGYAASRMDEIKAGLDDTWFCWSGPTTRQEGRNITAYYRIQGPRVVIEFSPQGMGGDPSDHVHTMYRDPTNDYGRVTEKRR